MLLHIAAAPGLEKANSGGEMPYHFADTPNAQGSAAKGGIKQRQPHALASIDDDSVFDPISDLAAPAQTPQQGKDNDRADFQEAGNVADDHQQEGEQTQEDQQHRDDEQNLSSYAEDDSALSVPESPAGSWLPDQASSSLTGSIPNQSEDYSWSADLMGRLNLSTASPSDRHSDRHSEQQLNTPSSAAAIGSAPSTTLSEFSVVGRNLGNQESADLDSSRRDAASRDSASKGSANKGNRSDHRSRRSGYGSNR